MPHGLIWVFISAQVVAYFTGRGRSGETPRKVLGTATGEQVLLAEGCCGPMSSMGKPIRYALKQRHAWMRIFRNAAIPLDNNASAAARRVVALLRKNALLVGHDGSGENHAILLTLAATAQVHGANPEAYVADVLLREQSPPAAQLDELLPHNWKKLFGEAVA